MGTKTSNTFLCMYVLLNKFNSANPEIQDKAPQSNQVHVSSDGNCLWEPFYLWSISQCSVDTTWFPFDKQICNLIFESWNYNPKQVSLTKTAENSTIQFYEFEPNGIWEIIGKSLSCNNLSDVYKDSVRVT